MKPWRPYWKTLDEVQSKLLTDARQSPFKKTKNLGEWISKLTFGELYSCDSDCEMIIEWNCLKRFGEAELHRPYEDMRWQVIVRFELALDFCRGRHESAIGYRRKEFNWNQDALEIYRWLLIALRHKGTAMCWANRRFGDPNRAYLEYSLLGKPKPSDLTRN